MPATRAVLEATNLSNPRTPKERRNTYMRFFTYKKRLQEKGVRHPTAKQLLEFNKKPGTQTAPIRLSDLITREEAVSAELLQVRTSIRQFVLAKYN